MGQQAAVKGWHVANWGFWGWLETGLKLVGIAAGIRVVDRVGDMAPGRQPGGG